MALVKDRWAPTIAVLPIGGHFTMGPADAARAVALIGAKVAIPVHYATFPILTGTPAELAAATKAKVVAAGARGDLGGLGTGRCLPIAVYLEIGPKRTFAGAVEWPGWCRIGRGEEEALEALLAYAPRYARVVEAAGLTAPADARRRGGRAPDGWLRDRFRRAVAWRRLPTIGRSTPRSWTASRAC